MILDYVASTGAFTALVDRSQKDLCRSLMDDHGFNFSSSGNVFFTKEPYAAVSFIDKATPFARQQLQGIADRIADSWRPTSEARIKCPMDKTLWPFQRADVEYALRRTHTLVGDQPGCGKTPVAICYANEISAKRVLVLCPASIRLQWADRIREWSTMAWPYIVYPVLSGRHGIHPNAAWTLVSYDLARTEAIGRALGQGIYDLVILDEAHYLKTVDSGRTRSVFGDHTGFCRNEKHENLFPAIAGRTGAVMALTGTPLPNRARECLDGSVQVLTNHGWKPIIAVTLRDKLWDGEEWVKHDGLLFQGCVKTVSVAGILATGTHRFLAKSKWVSAAEVAQNTAMLSPLLESASANLPWSIWSGGRTGRFGKWVAGVIAEAKRLRAFSAFVSAGLLGAAPVGRRKGYFPDMPLTNIFALQTIFASGFCLSSSGQFSGVTTQTLNATSLMVGEESRSTKLGLTTERVFWRILFHYLGMKTRISNWIGSTTTKDTSQRTFGLSPARRIWETVAQWMSCKKELPNLRPVYDLANAGPRQRFTVLSNQGPMIVHNCYTLARNLCFDSIDWMSEKKFNERFNPVARLDGIRRDGSTYQYTREETGRAAELQARLRANFMVRHLKRDVMTQLKLPIYDLVHVEETKAVKQALAAESLLEIDPETFDGTDNISILGHIAVVRHQMGLAIAPQVAEYAGVCLDGGEDKLVLFAWHTDVLDFLERRLSRFGTLRIDGSTSVGQRQLRVKEFQENPKMRIMLGNTMAMGTGTDGLQKVCSHALLAEPEWVPGNNEQAIDRLDRGGQERTVQADIFVAMGSLLQKILASALRKRQNTHAVLDRRMV